MKIWIVLSISTSISIYAATFDHEPTEQEIALVDYKCDGMNLIKTSVMETELNER